jgi:hypothetical protein
LWIESWPSREIVNLQSSLANIESLLTNQNPAVDDDINSSLARFLVVRTCGFVEQITEQCCMAYLQSKSDPRSALFAKSWFGRGAGPKPDSLVKLVQRFDIAWAEDLKKLLDSDDELLSRELSFLVDRRNKIAHGLSEGIGVRKALNLLKPARVVSDWFIKTFDPR